MGNATIRRWPLTESILVIFAKTNVQTSDVASLWTLHNTFLLFSIFARNVCVLTLFDKEVGQRQHDSVATVQEVPTHQVRSCHRQTFRKKN